MKNYKQLLTPVFLLAQGILYYLILTTGGEALVWSSFGAIALCFFYVLAGRGKPLLVAGLAGTVAADYFLVLCGAQNKLAGMVCFLIVQTLYAIFLHREGFGRPWLVVRLSLIGLATAVALVILGAKTDALALVSVWYYANLILNAAMAFGKFRKFSLLAIGFLLFILCDTVIGLQVATQGYLSIGEDTLLYRILFMDFNLAWFFYLPSQVLIALTGIKSK